MSETLLTDPPLPRFETLALDSATIADLRSDHAGETGAVAIYRGMLAVSRDAQVRAFAAEHLETECRHLAIFERWLPSRYHSRLLPLWRLAGWLTGALPALVGRSAVFSTVAAVETFVERHYQDQIRRLERQPSTRGLSDVLKRLCADEVEHKEDAERRISPPGTMARLWLGAVGIGSALGVAVARRI